MEADILKEISILIKNNSNKLNTLLEFPTIVYTLTSIHEFIDYQDIESMCDIPMKKLGIFLGDFFEMYDTWVKSVFCIKRLRRYPCI